MSPSHARMYAWTRCQADSCCPLLTFDRVEAPYFTFSLICVKVRPDARRTARRYCAYAASGPVAAIFFSGRPAFGIRGSRAQAAAVLGGCGLNRLRVRTAVTMPIPLMVQIVTVGAKPQWISSRVNAATPARMDAGAQTLGRQSPVSGGTGLIFRTRHPSLFREGPVRAARTPLRPGTRRGTCCVAALRLEPGCPCCGLA